MLVERTGDVSNDQRPVDALTVHVTAGARGEFTLYDGSPARITQDGGVVTVHPARGSVSRRDWTVVVHNADGTTRSVQALDRPTDRRTVIDVR